MDLAQKANRAKRDLQAAAHKPEPTSIKHAIDSFDAFVDGVVEEIGKLKAVNRSAEQASPEFVAQEAAPADVAETTDASDAAGAGTRRRTEPAGA